MIIVNFYDRHCLQFWPFGTVNVHLQRIKMKQKGTEPFPSSFIPNDMNASGQTETVQKLLEPLLTEDVFLVGIKIKPTNNIKVYVDADKGLGIEKCTRINRALYKSIEEAGLYPNGDFSLEVSSPGIDEPLKLLRQYNKNIGRDVQVQLSDDKLITGKLTTVSENDITLEYTEGKNKKAVLKQETIPFDNIKKTIVQIKF